MRTFRFLRVQVLAGILLALMASSTRSVVNDWPEPQGELINRPDGPYACLPREPGCTPDL